MTFIHEVHPDTYEANAGTSIWAAAHELVKQPRDKEVTLVFNAISVRVYPGSCEEDVVEKYSLLSQMRYTA